MFKAVKDKKSLVNIGNGRLLILDYATTARGCSACQSIEPGARAQRQNAM